LAPDAPDGETSEEVSPPMTPDSLRSRRPRVTVEVVTLWRDPGQSAWWVLSGYAVGVRAARRRRT
jgi:hypothetical protein